MEKKLELQEDNTYKSWGIINGRILTVNICIPTTRDYHFQPKSIDISRRVDTESINAIVCRFEPQRNSGVALPAWEDYDFRHVIDLDVDLDQSYNATTHVKYNFNNRHCLFILLHEDANLAPDTLDILHDAIVSLYNRALRDGSFVIDLSSFPKFRGDPKKVGISVVTKP